jgi:hypothetical protein
MQKILKRPANVQPISIAPLANDPPTPRQGNPGDPCAVDSLQAPGGFCSGGTA